MNYVTTTPTNNTVPSITGNTTTPIHNTYTPKYLTIYNNPGDYSFTIDTNEPSIQNLYDSILNPYLNCQPPSSMNLNWSTMDINFNCFNLKIKLFKHISVDEIVKGKVYKFTFDDKTKIKTVYSDDDINFFSFDYAVCLAIAKYMFKDVFTFEAILEEAYNLEKLKPIQKIIKQLEKEVKEQRKEKEKKKEYEEIKKRQHARYIRRKIERKERKKQEQIDIIKQAIK